jgi:glycosyltransferase involved in cell wall biosynthesis
LKYVYTHTPARYVWEPDRDKRGDNPLAKIASSVLKPIDKMRAQEAYKVAANSEFTKQKIQLAWNREAQVIYPPVRVSEIQRKIELGLNLSKSDALILSELPSEFILGASRFVPYKNLERVIQIGEWLKIPVVIAGSGPLVDQLETRAKNSSVTVSIVQRPSDDLLFALYKKSVAYIFPPVEDFGIMPVEASAAGARVLANYKGGASESVLDGVNGALVDMESKSDIISGFDRLRSLDFTNASTFINKFDKSEFRRNIEKWVSS